MKLVDTAIKKPVSVAVGVIFVVLFGFISIFRIPVQLTPDVDKPMITVSTFWPGASPHEVETEIIRKQEDELKAVDSLVEMTSQSQDSMGSIVLEFEVGTDIEAAVVDVANKLNQVPDYPDDVEQPVISTTDVGASAMAWFILRPAKGSEVDIYAYHDFAEDYIKPAFERVPGVGSSNVYGGYEREMQVMVDPNALAARGITLLEMAAALERENDNYSAGDFDEGKRRYTVRAVGEYKSAEDIGSVIIARKNGAPVYVRDVAEVRLGFKDAEFAVRQDGAPGIAINAVKEAGANSIEVMKGLNEATDKLNQGELKKFGLELENVYEETGYIVDAIDLVKDNILVGGLLAILVLFFSLRSVSSTLIVAIATPLSVVGTFVVMMFMGRTINVVSLAGMAFAVGLIIDNSIVVLENIYRHMEMGKSRIRASYDGTVEVWGALVANTITTTSVFIPVIFAEDQAGQLFRDIAIAITVTSILSLFVSITVIPAVTARTLTIARKTAGLSFSNLWGFAAKTERMSEWTAGLVRRIISHKGLRAAVICGFTFGSIFLSWAMIPRVEYLPAGNQNLVFGILIPPPGYNVAEFTEIGKQIENDIRPYWEAEPGTPEAEKLAGPPIDNFFYVATGRQAFMGASTKEEERIREALPVLQESLSKIPGMIAIVTQASLFETGMGEGRAVIIRITGPDMEKLIALGQQIFFAAMEKLPEAQVMPMPSLDLGNPELQLVLDRERASDVGISNEALGFMLNALVDGAIVSEYQLDGDEIDITLRGKDEFASRTQALEDLTVNTESGKMITLGSIADVSLTTGPEQINHYERQRTIGVSVTPPMGMPLETAIEIINSEILDPMRESGQLGGAYDVIMSGAADDLSEAMRTFLWNLLLAAVICFLFMSSLYESFIYPFVIMFSVPLASFGGFLGLFILNLFVYEPLNILTMLGFIILIGSVVNNAILIVHQALNYMREEGMAPTDAIVEAVKTRIRPIFISTFTSVVGMLPLVVSPGSGSEFYRGLGSVVVGGLTVSTVFTIVLVPAVFSLVLEWREGAARRLGPLMNSIRGLVHGR